MKRPRSLMLALVLGGPLLSACGDVHISLQKTPAIEVLNEAGESHLTAAPWLEVSFQIASTETEATRGITVRSIGGEPLTIESLCVVRATTLAQARDAECIPIDDSPVRLPWPGDRIEVAASKAYSMTLFRARAIEDSVFLRIESNSELEPVVHISLIFAIEAPPVEPPPVEPPPVEPPPVEPPPVEPACMVTDTITPEEVTLPADIIWVIDSSGSMDSETRTVRDNLNTFSTAITNSGIDHHVIVIGDASAFQVPPPLGTSSRFLMIDQSVGSTDALEKLLSAYPLYQSFLRPDSVKHIIVVSDDDSDMSASTFRSALTALTDPGLGPRWYFHSIVAFGTVPVIGCIQLPEGVGSAIGREYLALSQNTAGVTFPICDQDWSPVFDAIEAAVATASRLPCVFALPPPPVGEQFDWTSVAVDLRPTSAPSESIPSVVSELDCQGAGWYFDDANAPTEIAVCTTTCEHLHDRGGVVEISVSCLP